MGPSTQRMGSAIVWISDADMLDLLAGNLVLALPERAAIGWVREEITTRGWLIGLYGPDLPDCAPSVEPYRLYTERAGVRLIVRPPDISSTLIVDEGFYEGGRP